MQRLDHARVDADDLADVANVVLTAGVIAVEHLQLLRADQSAVAARQADSFAASLIDQAHDILLHLPGQDPLDDFHRFIISHAHTLDEVAFFAQPVQRRLNLRTTAMHHDRVHTH